MRMPARRCGRSSDAKSTEEIIFTRNTTESLNLVAYSYGLSRVKAGDEVLVSIMEHHSNLLPWQMVCQQTGATAASSWSASRTGGWT